MVRTESQESREPGRAVMPGAVDAWRGRRCADGGWVEVEEMRAGMEGAWLMVLAHELRTPLAAVTLAIESWGAGGESGADDEGREAALRGAAHMSRVIEEVLELARRQGEAGRCHEGAGEERVPGEESVLGEAVEVVRGMVAREFAGRGQRLTVSLPAATVRVRAGATRLRQVMLNLLGNASRYTPAGGEVELAAREDGGELELRVRDNGVGRTEELRGRMFEFLARGAGACEGCGIGLAVVRTLVELDGGTVAATSDGVGRGTEFVVRLPLCPGG